MTPSAFRTAGAILGVIGVALGVGTSAQSPAATGPQASPAPVTNTVHAPLPVPSRYWMVPDAPSRLAQSGNNGLAQFARGVKLIEADSLTAGLPLVANAPVDSTPLFVYSHYYTGVALVGLGLYERSRRGVLGHRRASRGLPEGSPAAADGGIGDGAERAQTGCRGSRAGGS